MNNDTISIRNDDTSIREEFVSGTIDRIYNSIVGQCKKCDGGFLTDDKKISSVKDLAYSEGKECSCYKRYKRLKNYVISGIHREFWGMVDIVDKDLLVDERSKKKFSLYLSKLNNVFEKGFGIIFLGSPEGLSRPNNGTGKTALASKILEHALALGKSAHYITMHSYFNTVYRSKGEGEQHFYTDLIDEIEDVDVLCIDEVGKVNQTEFVYHKFEDTIRRRQAQCKVTILITNMSIKELESFVGPSLMDIIRNTMIDIMLVGKTLRDTRFADIKRSLKWEI